MPKYDYQCKENCKIIEVMHPMSVTLKTWGELCAYAEIELGILSSDEPVERIITSPPLVSTPVGNAGLKNLGFTRLEKRDDGVYENVTRTGSESRYMKAGDLSSMPHLHKKISD